MVWFSILEKPKIILVFFQIQSPEPLTGSSMLVPIIIGILVGIVVIVVVVFFVVKRKRNQNKYDAEKAVASKDETQKLNENPDV